MALQMSQERSPPCAKEDFPALCELRDSKEVHIGGQLIPFGHGDKEEKWTDGGIQQRTSAIRLRMSTIKQRANTIEQMVNALHKWDNNLSDPSIFKCTQDGNGYIH
jgi:hypothetical protein